MKSNEVRQAFFDFFKSKSHEIVKSAPMVVKNDPTLMFTNAGMNQFKDLFLGNSSIIHSRIADSQKCLRVSGKHNDLEEVGHDTYHHTMFEMLGNWSFGDYFKKEAIEWGWEFLTKTLELPKDRLYASVFEGDKSDKLDFDHEAFDFWKTHIPDNQIINGSKKDNFWEMGETGPCGPCSEIHIDLRKDTEREKIPGRDLVNKDHPLVIEIWNLVFIQFNRKANGQLEILPAKHVDTGMGFERLCMAMQGVESNYDTDIFQPIIQEIASQSGFEYGKDQEKDIAMRVISDHIRAIAFAISDGQLPSNNKAGYVIRRILRRAVRYGYTFLNFNDPFIYKLLHVLNKTLGNAYPELISQNELIKKVIFEEEQSFLRTLETGIKKLDKLISQLKKNNQKLLNGAQAFELYDTYGFPSDLTELILKEKGLSLDVIGFEKYLEEQKQRSRNATSVQTDDWIIISEKESQGFIGYNILEAEVQILKYRSIKEKKKEFYQLVFDKTPFYAESGGQVGDTGILKNTNEEITIFNTLVENNLIVHFANKIPTNAEARFIAKVNSEKRLATANNHTATHLMHYALRKVLGSHVEQKGSLVNSDYLRFDFSHFQKMTEEEILKVEKMVNQQIRENSNSEIFEKMSIDKAKEMGAMALFGEKYGDDVRVVKFGDSVELCGGTHVKETGQIGFFKITSESAIAAGIRRIEAVTSEGFERYLYDQDKLLKSIGSMFKNQSDLVKNIKGLIEQNENQKKQIDELEKEKTQNIKKDILASVEKIGAVNFISKKMKMISASVVKDLAFQLKNQIDNLFLVIGVDLGDKASLSVMISENLIKEKDLHAGRIIKEISKEIKGGGGGQPFFATAGGKNPEGINMALEKAKAFIK